MPNPPTEDLFATKPGSDFDPLALSALMTRRAHAGWLGMAYEGHGDGWVELSLPWREDLVGVPETGVLASGPIISLMDNATSISVWSMARRFLPHATLDLRVDYVRAAEPGRKVIGRGECYKLTRTIAFVRGIAHDGDPDDPVAHVIGTFMATHGTYL
ncbi:MAG: hotdog fold thioesterase [Proteobacteria bacterium]|nr:hotdog fold thioesterase [Pseudomonadota bacterium]MDE2411322.1 hotdog fold thioesterase [Sphingomonadales bacterium]